LKIGPSYLGARLGHGFLDMCKIFSPSSEVVKERQMWLKLV